ncbi:MAG: Na+/H+ antiporter subunit E [Synergistaceae bacterium]|nr:Na+/H+ antiporter subunit E [Synergistaceae bacterium]MBR0257665.1 Na+/H+ antiporter subunit E [Synergistaceae bacterium]
MSLVYFLLWLIFNGRITFEIVVIGALISFMLDLFIRKVLRLNLTVSNLIMAAKILPDIVLYVIVLLVEIVRANFSITRLVLSPRIEVEPCLVKFRTPLKTEAARVALANSITLTPGTITVSLDGDNLLVHALNRKLADGLEGSVFERLLARMERILHV